MFQGMKNPIGTSGQVSRGGLGSINSQIGICHQSVNAKLTAFIRNPDLKKLEFTAELENVERKVRTTLFCLFRGGHVCRI